MNASIEDEPAAQREAGAAEEQQKFEETTLEHQAEVEARIHVEKKTSCRVEEPGLDDEEGTWEATGNVCA